METALAQLMSLDVNKIVLVPMFPHFAQATVGAFLANTCRISEKLRCRIYLQVVPPFYKDPGFIDVWCKAISRLADSSTPGVDHIVFSFHGIPESQCWRTDETESICMKVPNCCSSRHEAIRNCYRAQCLET